MSLPLPLDISVNGDTYTFKLPQPQQERLNLKKIEVNYAPNKPYLSIALENYVDIKAMGGDIPPMQTSLTMNKIITTLGRVNCYTQGEFRELADGKTMFMETTSAEMELWEYKKIFEDLVRVMQRAIPLGQQTVDALWHKLDSLAPLDSDCSDTESDTDDNCISIAR